MLMCVIIQNICNLLYKKDWGTNVPLLLAPAEGLGSSGPAGDPLGPAVGLWPLAIKL